MHTSFLFIRFSMRFGRFSERFLLCERGARSSYSNQSAAEPPQSNMAPPSEDNGNVKKDITKLPWRCAHHIRVIYTVNDMLLCLGYGCSSASPPPLMREGGWMARGSIWRE